MKIATVVGARPQFIKAAAVSRAIREYQLNGSHDELSEIIIHTGQHYDNNMSQVFFDEMNIPEPDYCLDIAGGAHGAMTGRMLEKIEAVLVECCPALVLVYGDTNSTLAGALAAVKLHIPIAHVEAGLRSFNMKMPEEINRIVTDRISSLLFCPTSTAVDNLRAEGITKGVHLVGDVMYDVALYYGARAREQSNFLGAAGLAEAHYALVTIHRAENTDDTVRLKNILAGLCRIATGMRVILPLHPRTNKSIEANGLGKLLERLTVIDPVSFIDMVKLERAASVIITDSGGVQKEAYFARVPCITLRDETEWTETVESGWNVLVGADTTKLIQAFEASCNMKPNNSDNQPYGDGNAAGKIVKLLRVV